jgi:hypothetical protein
MRESDALAVLATAVFVVGLLATGMYWFALGFLVLLVVLVMCLIP